jgi:hypothetical protein
MRRPFDARRDVWGRGDGPVPVGQADSFFSERTSWASAT